MVEHKLVSSSAVTALWTSVRNFTNKDKSHTPKVQQYIQDKNAAILAAMLRKRSQVSSTDHKNRASAASHINTSKFYEGKSGEASSRKPSQPG